MDTAPTELFRHCCDLLRRGDPRAAALLPRLEGFPLFAPGWEQIAGALEEAGQARAAEIAYLRAAQGYAAAARSTPRETRLPFAEGQCLRRAHRPAEAAFARAVEIDGHHAEAWFGLGLARQDAGDRPGAVAAFEVATQLRPDWHEAAFNLGVARQEAGDLDGATAAYADALRTRPDSLARIAQALTTQPRGRLFLDLDGLRRVLARP